MVEGRVLAIFQNWDVHGTGFISEDDLSSVLGKLGVEDTDFRVLAATSGTSSRGRITYDKFFSWIFKPPSSLPAFNRSQSCSSDLPAEESPSSASSTGSKNWTLSMRRLMHELQQVQSMLSPTEGPIVACSLNGDNLADWKVELKFAADTPLQCSMEDYARRGAPSQARSRCLELQVKFAPEYPFTPPEIWVRRPRLLHLSAAVSFSGKVCLEALTSEDWVPSKLMSDVILELHRSLLKQGAKVDVATSSVCASYSPTPLELNRLSTRKFPTASGFKRWLTAISAVEAKQYLRSDLSLPDSEVSQIIGDLTLLESTDKIALPFHFAGEIYEHPDVELPLMFELKTKIGRKTHCGIFEFMHGLPEQHALLPRWVMNDLFLEEGDCVQIRCVSLRLITKVKVQPHTMEFYEAVREAGGDVAALLTENLRRLSALTEGTSVPVMIGHDRQLLVEIIELEPQSAVRIIDSDITKDFEFKVDFDPAPDFEDEATREARQEELLARHRERLCKEEEHGRLKAERHWRRREETFRKYRDSLSEELAVNIKSTGSSDAVEVGFRLPTGERLLASFCEGAPVSALKSYVLQSDWANATLPWDVALVQSFPKRYLSRSEFLSRELHRAILLVWELRNPEMLDNDASNADEEPDEHTDRDAAGDEGLDAPPSDELDWERCFEQTRAAFVAQRELQHRALLAAVGGDDRPTVAHEESESREPPQSLQQELLQQLGAVADIPEETARSLLVSHSWDVDRAVNAFLDDGGLDRQPPLGHAVSVQPELIDQVVTVSGCTAEAARDALERTGWDVPRAIDAVLEMEHDEG